MNSEEAYDRMVKHGDRVRLPNWPEGQYLKYVKRFDLGSTDGIAVYRGHKLSSHNHSPSASELNSKDWSVYRLPIGVDEKDTYDGR